MQHPGIVPVYGLQWEEDDEPCYAMNFIDRHDLQTAIDAFHKADQPGRDAAERSFGFRQLLNHFVSACNTIAYAHSRGVLHRDLKPKNIMLGQYGETLVVDWGLAKAGIRDQDSEVGKSAVEANAVEAPIPDSVPPDGTQAGQQLGTAPYMSPEQAAGDLKRLGPATDVYSLGATLYAILTGQAPIQGTTRQKVLELAHQGQFAKPRAIMPNVPGALEAICLKALALQPVDRYASAKILGTEVEHWLADKPIQAWRAPLAVRARRWLRQHRILASVALTFFGLVVLAVLITPFLTPPKLHEFLRDEYRGTVQQLEELEQGYRYAHQALKDCVALSEDPRFSQLGPEDLRGKVYEIVKAYRQHLVTNYGDERHIQSWLEQLPEKRRKLRDEADRKEREWREDFGI